MKLIGDSGSTKTDWRLINQNEIIKQFSCKGLNPHFHSKESIADELRKTFDDELITQVSEIHFYGAGCSSTEKKAIVNSGFKNVFTNSRVNIYHDLLGAARACCGKNNGLAGILGTGSNCCLYDGNDITMEFKSGGYIIGDEGGGVDIGRKVIKAIIEEAMPSELQVKFERQYKISYDEILNALYKQEYPNRFLAGFSQFAYHNRTHLFIQELIQENFRAYFKIQVVRIPECKDYQLGLIGSVAFYYQDIIKSVAEEFGVSIGTIVEKPISGIALYHLD
jgi:N-acetylglucosamine kinase-like BadF-type ATPase